MDKDRKYNNSVKGIARQLRSNHGYNQEESFLLAKRLTDDYCRCYICGIPVWWLKVHKGYYPGKLKEEKMRRRLTVDHIDPNGTSILSNSRPLCAECNNLKGANRLSDEEVLEKMKYWWRNYSGVPLRFLFWLNEDGTLFRNKFMDRKERKFRETE